tara:strand:+ start:122 stop:334 length:213 start_codon:yes stop_codon:yes gene_type:complete
VVVSESCQSGLLPKLYLTIITQGKREHGTTKTITDTIDPGQWHYFVRRTIGSGIMCCLEQIFAMFVTPTL